MASMGWKGLFQILKPSFWIWNMVVEFIGDSRFTKMDRKVPEGTPLRRDTNDPLYTHL